jgi:hypothetical protein
VLARLSRILQNESTGELIACARNNYLSETSVSELSNLNWNAA